MKASLEFLGVMKLKKYKLWMHSDFLKGKLVVNRLTRGMLEKGRTYAIIPINFSIPKYSNTATKRKDKAL